MDWNTGGQAGTKASVHSSLRQHRRSVASPAAIAIGHEGDVAVAVLQRLVT